MAVAVVNHYIAEGGVDVALSLTSATVGSGEGLVVLVIASNGASAPPAITSVTWHGTSMTRFADVVSSADGASQTHRFAVFYLIAPEVGTFNVITNFDSSTAVFAAEAVTVSGHDTSTMMRASSHATNQGGATAPTVNSATVSGDLVLDLVRFRNLGGQLLGNTAGAGQTKLDEAASGPVGTWSFDSSKRTASSTTSTMSWAPAPDNAWAMQAVAVMPPGSGLILSQLERRVGRGSFRGQY